MAILLLTFLSVWLSDQPERLKILVPVPAQSVEVKASSEYHEGDARRAIDGDGLEHHYHQSQNLGRGMWLTKISESEIQAHPNAHKGVVWLMTEFGDVRKIESLSVWNYNQDNHTDRGLRKVYLQYSADGTNWKTLMNGGEDFFTIPEAQGRKKEPASLEKMK